MTGDMKEPDQDSDMDGTLPALIRATRKALHEARIRGELVPQWHDGKVVWVHPDEVELLLLEQKRPPRAGMSD